MRVSRGTVFFKQKWHSGANCVCCLPSLHVPTTTPQTMASGMTVEVDLKRGSVWIRGRPEAVEDGRKDFHNKLASLFPGDFLSVRALAIPMVVSSET